MINITSFCFININLPKRNSLSDVITDYMQAVIIQFYVYAACSALQIEITNYMIVTDFFPHLIKAKDK